MRWWCGVVAGKPPRPECVFGLVSSFSRLCAFGLRVLVPRTLRPSAHNLLQSSPNPKTHSGASYSVRTRTTTATMFGRGRPWPRPHKIGRGQGSSDVKTSSETHSRPSDACAHCVRAGTKNPQKQVKSHYNIVKNLKLC